MTNTLFLPRRRGGTLEFGIISMPLSRHDSYPRLAGIRVARRLVFQYARSLQAWCPSGFRVYGARVLMA